MFWKKVERGGKANKFNDLVFTQISVLLLICKMTYILNKMNYSHNISE